VRAHASRWFSQRWSRDAGTSFERFLTEVGEMLDRAPETIGTFAMDELELSVSIAATCDFRIASSTASGALKVTLRRPSHRCRSSRHLA
jgi:hypothetical protein